MNPVINLDSSCCWGILTPLFHVLYSCHLAHVVKTTQPVQSYSA